MAIMSGPRHVFTLANPLYCHILGRTEEALLGKTDREAFPELAAAGPHLQVRRFVDQSALLPHCDLVVSHGGAGTLLGAAAHGVPQLVLPQAADHFRNARALLRVGGGRVIEPGRQTLDVVAAALAGMFEDPAIVHGAKRLAREMAALPDAAMAASRLEQWLACTPGGQSRQSG